MNMKTKWILPILILASIGSCKKETIELYESDEAKIYFQVQSYSGSNGAEGYSTSTTFSFVDRSLDWKDVTFKGTVQLMGNITDYDRACKVIVDEENTTMIEGEDYVIDLDTLKIKAGASKGYIGVRFLRSKNFKEEAKKLTLQLLPNENFSILETYKASNVWSNTTAEKIDGSRFTFTIDEIYKKPSQWDRVNAGTYFGTWTATKYAYINDFFGFKSTDWEWATNKISKARMPFYANALQKDLQQKADEGTPVYDEDGSYMQLGDAYKINYDNVNVKQ